MQNIISEILKEIDNEIIQIQKSLGDGNCEDYSRYRQMVGANTGLDMALKITKKVYKQMIDGDDDADD